MNLQQLKVFVLTAKLRKLTLVAQALHISQPTVTFHLNKLQEEWRLPLFLSNSRRLLKLTDAGQSLLHYAEQMVGLENEIQLIMQQYQELRKGRLSIGATHTPATYVLPEYLSAFKKQYPQIDLTLEVKTAPVILEMVKKYELDVGIVSYDAVEDKEIQAEKLYRARLVLVLHPEHPLAGRERLTVEQLQGQPFILHEQGSVSRRLLDQWAQEQELGWEEVMEVSATETMKEAVMQGMGLAVMSERSCRREVAEGKLVCRPLPGCTIERYKYLIYRKNKLPTPAMRAFMQMLEGLREQQGGM